MTRIAIISDIHSNAEALEAVLDDIDHSAIDAIWCLGDIVGYAHDPVWCLRTIEQRADVILTGNHDLAVAGGLDTRWFNDWARAGVDYSRTQLNAEDISLTRRILQRPSEIIIDPSTLQMRRGAYQRGDIVLAHACPSPFDAVHDYIRSDVQPREIALAYPDASFVAVGHTHDPFVYEHPATTPNAFGVLVMNVGSVGQPRDEDPRACWTLVELGSDGYPEQVRFRRVDYDVERAAERINAAGLPTELAFRLEIGA